VARLVSDEERARGALYPPISAIREVSAHVARAVAAKAYEHGFATELPKAHSLLERAKQCMYNPQYRRYR
jgi:malate dehydrogenase (oxaloacetate-decarboxylating)(NADP+)